MVSFLRWEAAVSLALLSPVAMAQSPVGGTVRGSVTDKEFGAPVEGASVSLMGTRVRAVTSETGSFSLPNVPAGTYTLIFSKDGFVREVRSNVVVSGGQLTDVSASLAGEFEDLDEVVVQDMAVEQQEMGPIEVLTPPEVAPPVIIQPGEFTLRLESPQLLDIVGVETISRSGAGDAAAALLLVPGASLQEGKYAVVRGLPDRYVSVLLDGVRLPVSTPGKRAVQLDQFPASVIQSIQVSKSFTPDLQGEASGGGVNVVLRDIPDGPILDFRAQYGMNSQVKDGSFLTYPGGGLDFWGNNDVLQTYPELAGQPWPDNPTGTTTGDAPPIYKFSGSVGDSWEITDDVRIGAFGTFYHENGASYYDNGQLNNLVQNNPGTPLGPWTSTDPDAPVDPTNEFLTEMYDVTQGTQSVQWGGMGSAGIETDDHKLGIKYLYTNLSESQAVLLTDTRGKDVYFPGYDVNDPLSPGNDTGISSAPWRRNDTLGYSKVTTEALILNGDHRLSFLGPGEEEEVSPGPLALGPPTIDWRVAFSKAIEDQPDQTQFSSLWLPFSPIVPPFPGPVWTQNAELVPIGNFGFVQHINYYNEEASDQGQLNIKVPFLQWNDREGYLKAGGFVDSVARQYRQDTFNNQAPYPVSGGSFPGPWDNPWANNYPPGDPMMQSEEDVSYNGDQLIAAGYGMIDLPFNETMNLVGGVRYETTDMTTTMLPDANARWIDVSDPSGSLAPIFFSPAANSAIEQVNWLPMVGLNWNLMDDLVLRGAYAETLARPNFFEIVPVLQYAYIGAPIFVGNPGLQMSSLDNYDLRLDWTPEQDWLISGSVFYKSIEKPIQYVMRYANWGDFTTPQNFPSGSILGAEFEGRITLEPLLGEAFRGLAVGGNFTWMQSQVDLPDDEIARFRGYGIDLTSTDMTGTPNYLWNANVTYDFGPWGTQLGVFYNVQGKSQISGPITNADPSPPNPAGGGGTLTPAIYQLPYGTLNVTLRQPLIWGFAMNFSAKNLTNPARETQFETTDGFTGLNSTYTAGVDLAFGVSLNLIF